MSQGENISVGLSVWRSLSSGLCDVNQLMIREVLWPGEEWVSSYVWLMKSYRL